MTEPLFSLVYGEGDGATLGLAAGDTAGGAWELGYSAITQQATVTAYELIANGRLTQDAFVDRLLELDGAMDEEPVFRAESPEFRAWLDRAVMGTPTPDETPSLDPAGRSPLIGVTYRRDPGALVKEVVALNRLFHTDAGSILSGVAVAAAVAASCFGQWGRDLLLGVSEAVRPAIDELGSGSAGLSGVDDIEGFDSRVRSLVEGYGIRGARDILNFIGSDKDPGPLESTLACLLLTSQNADKPHEPVAESARIGGSNLGAAAGAIVGARAGIRAWPWVFPNDTWFAEIGRRLVRGPQEIRDLPIPYAVEQHLNSGPRLDQQ